MPTNEICKNAIKMKFSESVDLVLIKQPAKQQIAINLQS